MTSSWTSSLAREAVRSRGRRGGRNVPLDLVSADAFLTNRKEVPPWILRPFLVNGSTMMLYGRQGIGKSSLALQLAYSLTSGEPWMGFPVARSGPVIYLQLDMSVEE